MPYIGCSFYRGLLMSLAVTPKTKAAFVLVANHATPVAQPSIGTFDTLFTYFGLFVGGNDLTITRHYRKSYEYKPIHFAPQIH